MTIPAYLAKGRKMLNIGHINNHDIFNVILCMLLMIFSFAETKFSTRTLICFARSHRFLHNCRFSHSSHLVISTIGLRHPLGSIDTQKRLYLLPFRNNYDYHRYISSTHTNLPTTQRSVSSKNFS